MSLFCNFSISIISTSGYLYCRSNVKSNDIANSLFLSKKATPNIALPKDHQFGLYNLLGLLFGKGSSVMIPYSRKFSRGNIFVVFNNDCGKKFVGLQVGAVSIKL